MYNMNAYKNFDVVNTAQTAAGFTKEGEQTGIALQLFSMDAGSAKVAYTGKTAYVNSLQVNVGLNAGQATITLNGNGPASASIVDAANAAVDSFALELAFYDANKTEASTAPVAVTHSNFKVANAKVVSASSAQGNNAGFSVTLSCDAKDVTGSANSDSKAFA